MFSRNLLFSTALILLAGVSARSQQIGTLPEGSNIVVRLTERLSSDSNKTGDVFHAVLDQEGRGSVELVQQPSTSNSFTAVVTIRDDEPGADFYEFELTW
jgi:hypothetical protein